MTTILTPDTPNPESFRDATAAVDRLTELYQQATTFLHDAFAKAMETSAPDARVRAFYPELRFRTSSYAHVDTRLSFGHVSSPGTFAATITRPDLFRNYLIQQIGLLIENHDQPVIVGPSTTPIPVHFAMSGDNALNVPQEGAADFTLRDVFDVPDLSTTNDDIVNGTYVPEDDVRPLAPFTAQRVDYSLARLAHYTATDPEHFQTHVLFTNYQFYVTEFEQYAREMLRDPESGYTAFVSTGNAEITDPDAPLAETLKTPQMPT
ncbi:MAG: AMP nucleosidase, partial [Sulfitobacter sp.]